MRIRPMKESDIEVLVSIEQDLFTSPWGKDSFIAELENRDSYFFIFENKDRHIAYIGFRKVLDEAHIMRIGVKKDQQGKGYGRKLIEAIISSAIIEGIRAITLEVRRGNIPAINLYESMGFEVEGLRPNYYERPKEDCLIMWKRNLIP